MLLRGLVTSILLSLACSLFLPTTQAAGPERLVRTDGQPAVYYVYDGARYAFPSERVFFSWYGDYGSLEWVTAEALAALPLRGTVTYRPGRLVKITTDPKVYAVARDGSLRWVTTEAVAQALYGADWSRLVDDVDDSLFFGYRIGEPLQATSGYSPLEERLAYASFGQALAGRRQGNTPSPAPAVMATTTVVTAANWREEALRLPIEGYGRSVDADGLLHLTSDGGAFEVILPDLGPNAEAYGRYELRKLKRDTDATRAALGRGPYLAPGRIIERFAIVDPAVRRRVTGSCCGPLEEGLPLSWFFGSEEEYLAAIDLGTAANAYVLRLYWEGGTGNHELVHRFIRGQHVYGIIDEGLANYLPTVVLGGGRLSQECRADGFVRSGSDTVTPYYQPDQGSYDAGIFYASGECFWAILERTYGREPLPRLFDRLREVPRGDLVHFSTEGLSDAELLHKDLSRVFVPVLGPSAWQTFAGFGARETLPARP